jgi:peptide/nickel transport system substrate-binding protein
MNLSRGVVIVGACLVVLVGTVTESNRRASASSSKPMLTMALGSAPTSLDPSLGSGATNVIYQAPAYQGLLHLEGNGGTQTASLASSYKWIGSNNSKLEIVLRPGLKFSDGTPLNSAAVEASAEHFATNGSAFAYVGQEIASMDTPDTRTIIFNLKAPDPTFANELAETSGLGMIISPKAIADKTSLGTSTDGAGPYELSKSGTIEGSTYTFTPNPHYYDPAAIKYSKVVIKVIADPNTAVAATESGQVQVTYGDPDTVVQAKSSGLLLASFPGSTDGLYFDDDSGTLTSAMGNVDVRRAINLGIDRKAVAKVVTQGTGQPTDEMAIPGTAGYEASLQKTYPYDLTKAKKLMAEGGFPHGFTLTTTVPTFMPTANNLAQILASELSKIGITMQIIGGTTFPAYAEAQQSGKYDATIFSLPFSLGIPSAITLGFEADALGNPRHETFPSILPAAAAANALPIAKAAAAWQAVNTTIVTQGLEAPVDNEAQIYYYDKSVKGVSESISLNVVFMSPTT